MIEPRLRIGEMSRRLGVSPQLLRAWERRYGLLAPERTAGGYRLYTAADERRVRLLLRHLDEGLSTAEAARLARRADAAAPGPVAAPPPDALARVRERLLDALLAADESEAQAALDELFALTDLEDALVGVILPALVRIGEQWAAGDASVAAEHYATNIVLSRLLALARGWDRGDGPRAVLACLPGERHTLGLIAFGLLLRRRGWRISYLGADTPLQSVDEWVDRLAPAAVVVAAVTGDRFGRVARELRALAARVPVLLGGAGASPAFADEIGARACESDPVATADALDRLGAAAR